MNFLKNLDSIINQWTKLYSISQEIECNAIGRLAAKPVDILEAINGPYLRNIMKLYFEKVHLKKMSQEKRKPRVHAILVALTIRNRFILQPELMMNINYQEVVASIKRSTDHPDLFKDLDEEECRYLARHILTAREMLKVIPARQNQGLFLAVGALMEDSHVVYKTGGDPSRATRRRQDIFQTLTGIKPTKKTRKSPGSSPTNAKKTNGKGKGKGKGNRSKMYEESSDSEEEEEEYSSMTDCSSPDYHSISILEPPPVVQLLLPPVLTEQVPAEVPIISTTTEQLQQQKQQEEAMEEVNEEECQLMAFGTKDLLDIVESIVLPSKEVEEDDTSLKPLSTTDMISFFAEHLLYQQPSQTPPMFTTTHSVSV